MKQADLFLICFTCMFVGALMCWTGYISNDRILMSKNIEQAITKGIDPLSIKCAYTTNPDAICITYAMKK